MAEISISDFQAPTKERAENPYDATVEALAEFGDNKKIVTILAAEADITKELRKFREAVTHAGYRSREQKRETDEKTGTVSVGLTIARKKETKVSEPSETGSAAASE